MIYWDLFLGFLEVGCFSFGGGYGAISLIRDIVLARGWLNDETLTYMIAVSESTPGPIMVNMATYVGSSQGGILGALVATAAVVLPSFLIILLVMVLLKTVLQNKYAKAVLQGLKPCVMGIILATGVHMILRTCVTSENGLSVNLKSLLIVVLLVGIKVLYQHFRKKKLNPIRLILISAIAGIVFY